MAARILMVLSAGMILALGTLHLVYTFGSSKFLPRDRELQASMDRGSPVISKQTTMWKAWVGFNASHSMGAILFGLVYGYLAIAHDRLLFQSFFLLAVGLAMLGGLFALGKVYWFSVPFAGIGIALACYVCALLVSF